MTAATFNISSIAQRVVATQVEGRLSLPREVGSDYLPLTADSLLIFCQSRLRTLDEQISHRMATQQSTLKVQSAVTNLKEAISGQASIGFTSDGKVKTDPTEMRADDAAVDRGNAAFDAAIKEAKDNNKLDLAATLQSLKDKWNNGGDGRVGKDEMEGINKSVDSELANMGSSNEIQMIEMQSLISKRATALQLTTNMMNSMNESQKAIAGNIGR